jgi:hypothetical protein
MDSQGKHDSLGSGLYLMLLLCLWIKNHALYRTNMLWLVDSQLHQYDSFTYHCLAESLNLLRHRNFVANFPTLFGLSCARLFKTPRKLSEP